MGLRHTLSKDLFIRIEDSSSLEDNYFLPTLKASPNAMAPGFSNLFLPATKVARDKGLPAPELLL